MIYTVGLRQMPHVIKYQRSRGTIPQLFSGCNPVGGHVDLYVPAESRHTFRQRFDHVERGGRSRRYLTETEASNPSISEGFQLGIGHLGTHQRNAACCAKFCDSI